MGKLVGGLVVEVVETRFAQMGTSIQTPFIVHHNLPTFEVCTLSNPHQSLQSIGP